MSEKCKFCGEELLPPNTYCPTAKYACGSFPDGFRSKTCYEAEIAKLTAELKQLRDEDATDPIDERLAAAGKIFRELVAEREELRREVERLRALLNDASEELIDSLTMAKTADVMAGWIPTVEINDISNKLIGELTEAKQ